MRSIGPWTRDARWYCSSVCGILQVTGGRIWVTQERSENALKATFGHSSDPLESGDIFISAGEDLPLRAGQRVLLESFAPSANMVGAELRWVPDGVASTAPRRVAAAKAQPLPCWRAQLPERNCMLTHIENSLLEAQSALNNLLQNRAAMADVARAAETLIAAFTRHNKVYACGNGGSMCDAMHFAEELTGRYRLDRSSSPVIAISDASHMSCVGDDYGYEQAFSRYVESRWPAGSSARRPSRPAAPVKTSCARCVRSNTELRR